MMKPSLSQSSLVSSNNNNNTMASRLGLSTKAPYRSKLNRSVLGYDELIWNINGLEMKLPKFYMTFSNSSVNLLRGKNGNTTTTTTTTSTTNNNNNGINNNNTNNGYGYYHPNTNGQVHHPHQQYHQHQHYHQCNYDPNRDYNGELKSIRYNNAARRIQRAWRLYQKRKKKVADMAVARSKCDCPICYFRLLCKQHRLSTLNRAARLIQGYWLGYITRRRFLHDRSLRLLYKRIVTANSTATPEQTLGHRTENAINRLLSLKNFNNVDSELLTLETATKMSPVCCLKVATDIYSVILAIVNDSNRSELHKTRISYSMGILLNLCKVCPIINVMLLLIRSNHP